MKLIALSRSLHATKSSSRSSISHLQSRPFSAAAAAATSTAAKKYEYPKVYDPYGPRPPPSDKILGLAERIASLPPQELKQIGPALQLRLRHPRLQQISSRGLGGAGPRAGAAKAAEEKKAEEKTAFDVKLEKFDAAAKIKVIKEVRTFTNLGLKEAKELVEKVPVVLKQGVSKEEATGIIEKIKAVGGIAVME